MAVAALSSAGLSRYVLASSNASASQRALQSLQRGLASGNLTAAKNALKAYTQLNPSLTTGSANPSPGAPNAPTASQLLSSHTASLTSAIAAGNLKAARSAFTTLQGDLKTTPSQAMTNAQTAVTQTTQWVDDLLTISFGRQKPSTPADPLMSILVSSLGLYSPTANTDPTFAYLNSMYGTGTSIASGSSAQPSQGPGNARNSASVNAYA